MLEEKNTEINNPIPLVWDKKYNLGVPVVDDAHEKLFYLINRLIIAEDEQYDQDFIRELIYDFLEYVYSHFEEEEALMRKVDYPEYLEHKRIHQRLTDQTEEYLALYKSGQICADAFIEFTKNWLIHHILIEDMKIRDHIHLIEHS